MRTTAISIAILLFLISPSNEVQADTDQQIAHHKKSAVVAGLGGLLAGTLIAGGYAATNGFSGESIVTGSLGIAAGALTITPYLLIYAYADQKSEHHIVSLIAGGVIAPLVLTTGLTFYIDAALKSDAPYYELDSRYGGVDKTKQLGLMLAGAGLATMGISAAIYLMDDTDYNLRLAAAPSPGGGGMALSGSF